MQSEPKISRCDETENPSHPFTFLSLNVKNKQKNKYKAIKSRPLLNSHLIT